MNAEDLLQSARARHVAATRETLTVDLVDGRTIAVPLLWYPRLYHGKAKERNRWRLVGQGHGIHWPELDEDISVVNLLVGRPSGESQQSFQRWLDQRGRRRKKARS